MTRLHNFSLENQFLEILNKQFLTLLEYLLILFLIDNLIPQKRDSAFGFFFIISI